MTFKTLQVPVNWHENDSWLWPELDTKLLQVFHSVSDIDIAMKYVKDKSVVIQAGGAAGIWPLRLSQLFERVYTFEPHPINFRCLAMNCLLNAENIYAFNAAVGENNRPIHLDLLPWEENNHGAFQVTNIGEGNYIPTFTIDQLTLASCGLIYLDIEGFELFALKGAYNTIRKYRPVVVVEDKGLSESYQYKQGDIEKWMFQEFKYTVAERPARDVVLIPND